MAKLSARHAAIAQQVERILGKDEVASSNLASSSNPNRKVRVFSFLWHPNLWEQVFCRLLGAVSGIHFFLAKSDKK